jgi:bacillithiol synthase
MKKTIVPFTQTPQLAKTDVAYATGDPKLKPFYKYAPEWSSFEAALQDKAALEYPRKDLVAVLQSQYKNLPAMPQVAENIRALALDTTFTITTAHQPSLFLGPLYFIYKALTTIKLAQKLTEENSTKKRIVPVFVLGSEDHDVEELNKVNVFGKQVVWEPGMAGAVGSIPAETVQTALGDLEQILGSSAEATALMTPLRDAYRAGHNFAEATQALLHQFLGQFGLVVLNMNNAVLKRHFIPIMEEELMAQPSINLVNNTIASLNQAGFKTQAAPRDINLFYLLPGIRARIVASDGVFQVLNTDLVFTPDAIRAELHTHPERFSPNVVLRPLFQELILPNLAYVGGGGELAYWLERKAQFEHFKVPFPMLVRRHSVLWLDKEMVKKLDKFGFTATQFFSPTETLIREYIAQNATGEVSLATERAEMEQLFELLAQKASAIDPTLEKAVRADAVKAVGSLEQWESRLVRAEKQKHEVTLNQLRAVKEKLFPNNGLQERTDNILPYLLKYGTRFIEDILESLEPFDPGFVVLQPSETDVVTK